MTTNAYCGKCGSLLRPVGAGKRKCPKCHPEKVPASSMRPSNRTGVPCEDRGICRPEECVKALDCDDGRKHRRKG